MLEKEYGDILVDKLRAVPRMEADFKFANKLFFGQRLASVMDQNFFLPRLLHKKINTHRKIKLVQKIIMKPE